MCGIWVAGLKIGYTAVQITIGYPGFGQQPRRKPALPTLARASYSSVAHSLDDPTPPAAPLAQCRLIFHFEHEQMLARSSSSEAYREGGVTEEEVAGQILLGGPLTNLTRAW